MEAEFERAEQLRMKMEQRKKDFLEGKDRILEFIQNSYGGDPLMREYLELVYGKVDESLKAVGKEVLEQQQRLEGLAESVGAFESKLQEILDTLNLFAKKSLEMQSEHVERVRKTCDRIDREINL